MSLKTIQKTYEPTLDIDVYEFQKHQLSQNQQEPQYQIHQPQEIKVIDITPQPRLEHLLKEPVTQIDYSQNIALRNNYTPVTPHPKSQSYYSPKRFFH